MKKDSTSFATLGSRLFVSGTLIVCLTALAWADSTGFLGSLPGWWLLPVLILLAIAGVNEFISLYMSHGIRLKGGTLRVGVVAIFLAAAVGTAAGGGRRSVAPDARGRRSLGAVWRAHGRGECGELRLTVARRDAKVAGQVGESHKLCL